MQDFQASRMWPFRELTGNSRFLPEVRHGAYLLGMNLMANKPNFIRNYVTRFPVF